MKQRIARRLKSETAVIALDFFEISQTMLGTITPTGVLIMYVQLQPILSILAGVLILAMPKALNYIVATYLILIGISGLIQ